MSPPPRPADSPPADAVALFADARRPLISGLDAAILHADALDVVVAYAQPAGVALLAPLASRVALAGGRVRILVGAYLHGTAPKALHALRDLSARHPAISVRFVPDPTVHFHPKIYRVHRRDGRSTLFVGSSNLSFSALTGRGPGGPAIEWTLAVDDRASPAVLADALARLDALWNAHGAPLTDALITRYESSRRTSLPPSSLLESVPAVLERVPPRPAQLEALARLDALRDDGVRRALVVAATGLGKTLLAALDATLSRAARVLFLAHRDPLLSQARAHFSLARPDKRGAVLSSSSTDDWRSADDLFASFASLHRLSDDDLRRFDYVVVDEAHHGTASSFRAVLDRLPPEAFVLGLTATPHRLDGADVLALFDGVVAYEVGLLEAIARDWLVPFRYFGLPDSVDYTRLASARYEQQVRALLEQDDARTRAVADALRDPARFPGRRTLAFCASKVHADRVARALGDGALAVYSGSDVSPSDAITRLESGAIHTLCVVDLFNEGVDVPSIDRVAFLRPTDSPTVFLQQLGRGLRKDDSKSALVVVDFVGNHRRSIARIGWLGLDADEVLRAGREGFHRVLDNRCEMYFEPAALDAVRAVKDKSPSLRERVDRALESLRESAAREGAPVRVQYVDLLAASGLAHPAARPVIGSWAAYASEMGLFDEAERVVAERSLALLEGVETTKMTGPHKMLLLASMAALGSTRCAIDALAGEFRRQIARRGRWSINARDLESDATAARLLREMPIPRLARPDAPWFRATETHVEIVVPAGVSEKGLLALVAEIAEARLLRFREARAEGDGSLR
jgi:superfamily II DNA or RNA helicase